MPKFFLQSGAILGFLGVALGAFGAHAFRAMLELSKRSDTFETAVKYQFYHALALVAIGILLQLPATSAVSAKYYSWAGYAYLSGVLIFSGSLYTICFTGITKFGAVAPIGGLLMLAGWALLLVGGLKS
ncbi:DUF423 domain-containing protein [Larkinella humicola]|uniref:DUF423 domain-containing protein n=1 Tax=Larkinella humicola TaxID=2607654 RepID=A0A5N1J936_9BACT|nr:DUF423 domain-containing protein [Larkinella humicola]KAA9349167.1 DUF423 domain-containing protein [Larkinella humicola]